MPPKKKASAAAAPSTSIPPPPEKTSGGVDARGRTDIDEGAHGAARSKDKAAQTWRPYKYRAHLRRRRTDSVMVFAVPYVRWDKIELVDLGVLKTSMHANVLA